MTKVDQFESVFRAAAKESYAFQRVQIQRPIFVSDDDSEEASAVEASTRRFLEQGEFIAGNASWGRVSSREFESVAELLERVAALQPDLVCTWRNLCSNAWHWSFSLGSHVDVLTQVAPCPVLLVPHPEAGRAAEHSLRSPSRVMAITDRLAGDSTLVDWAASVTALGGSLTLAHVEDSRTFERYMDVISKLPAIDTETARSSILEQLLKEPRDYFRACSKELIEGGTQLSIELLVTSGHHLSEYKRIVEDGVLDLLVLETKNDEQLAMHGLAYALSIELREIPLLLL